MPLYFRLPGPMAAVEFSLFSALHYKQRMEVRYGSSLKIRKSFWSSLCFLGRGIFQIPPFPITWRLFNSHSYNMTYFHPRDFDFEQPIMPGLSPVRNFKNRVGLSSSRNKLRSLLKRFDFQDIYEAEKLVKWSTEAEVSLA